MASTSHSLLTLNGQARLWVERYTSREEELMGIGVWGGGEVESQSSAESSASKAGSDPSVYRRADSLPGQGRS